MDGIRVALFFKRKSDIFMDKISRYYSSSISSAMWQLYWNTLVDWRSAYSTKFRYCDDWYSILKAIKQLRSTCYVSLSFTCSFNCLTRGNYLKRMEPELQSRRAFLNNEYHFSVMATLQICIQDVYISIKRYYYVLRYIAWPGSIDTARLIVYITQSSL